jgi:hypothetical protein
MYIEMPREIHANATQNLRKSIYSGSCPATSAYALSSLVRVFGSMYLQVSANRSFPQGMTSCSYNSWIFAPCMIIISPCSRRILRTSFFVPFLLLDFLVPRTLTLDFGRQCMIELQPREMDATVGPRVFSPSSWYFNCQQRSLAEYSRKLTPMWEFSK